MVAPSLKQIAFTIAWLAAFADGAPALANDPAGAEIGFIDAAPQTLAPRPDSTFELDVALKNAGKEPGTPEFTLLGEKCGSAGPAAAQGFARLEPGAVAVEKLRISGATLPASCNLILRTKDVPKAAASLKPLKLAQHHLTSGLIQALWLCLGFALIATLVAVARRIGKLLEVRQKGKSLRLGSPAWDFAKSWTSTLTFAGGIVSAALALTALPELTWYGSKAGYATLALLLSLSTVIAPLLFTLFASGSPARESGKAIVAYQGHVGLFYLSCLITLAAGLAQILLLLLLLYEVFRTTDPSLVPYKLAAAALALAICWYAVRSMALTIDLQLSSETGNEITAPAATESTAPARPDQAASKAIPPSWPML